MELASSHHQRLPALERIRAEEENALHFGSRLAENYKMKFGAYPPKHGKTYIYYEIDRPLMEETWAQIQTEDAD